MKWILSFIPLLTDAGYIEMGNGLALGLIVSRTTLWIFGGPTS
jgi:hypothetical protein